MEADWNGTECIGPSVENVTCNTQECLGKTCDIQECLGETSNTQIGETCDT